jgi:hypothetical protein
MRPRKSTKTGKTRKTQTATATAAETTERPTEV